MGEDRHRSIANLMGADAETLALFWLRLKGYRLLARRYRAPGGEIDLIVKRGRSIVAVEVKARATLAAARTAITPRQVQRIGAGMAHFRAERRLDDRFTYRFDGVFIAPRHWPLHVRDVGELR
jgi:putative endonuclease